jgi:hypothetical protein
MSIRGAFGLVAALIVVAVSLAEPVRSWAAPFERRIEENRSPAERRLLEEGKPEVSPPHLAEPEVRVSRLPTVEATIEQARREEEASERAQRVTTLDLGHGDRLTPQTIATVVASSLQANILVSQPSLIQYARSALGTASPSNRLVMYKRTENPKNTIEALARPISALKIFHAFPRNKAEAERTHGPVASSYSDGYWSGKRERILALPDVTDIADTRAASESYATALRRALATPTSAMRVVIGEIRYGALRFPDGSALPLGDITSSQESLAIIGCTSARYVEPKDGGVVFSVGRTITYDEAGDIVEHMSKSLRSGGAKTARDLLLEFQNSKESALRAVVGVAINFVTVQWFDA